MRAFIDRLRRIAAGGLVAAFCVGLPSCSPRSAPSAPNIVLITIDTLRADHLPPYGYARNTSPEISRYFAEAVVYDNAYSAAAYTTASVVSALSGLYPPSHGVRGFYRKLSPSVKILPDHLRDLGYQSAAIVSNTVLTDEALGIASRFDHFDDFVDERELNRKLYERRASRTTNAALRWLALERDAERPHFLWIHFMDPHAPYTPPRDELGARFEHEGAMPLQLTPADSYAALPGVTDGLDYVDRYDEEIVYTDQEVGRFLREYERLGLLDDAIVILTSDHGEVLLERVPFFEHSNHIVNPVMRVPLLIRWPGGGPKRVARPISLIDLVPTLLDHLGVSIPTQMQGVPLDARRPDDVILLESLRAIHIHPPGAKKSRGAKRDHQRSAIRGESKWLFEASPSGRLERRGFIDLARDPMEVRPGPWPEDGGAMSRLLGETLVSEIRDFDIAREARAGRQLRGPKASPDALTAEQLDALKALGYAE